jgi:hypothetical protein
MTNKTYIPNPLYPKDEEGREIYLQQELNKISFTIGDQGDTEGEANTSSNVGTGVALALPKQGVDLPFRTLIPGTDITFTLSAQEEITINAEGGGQACLPLCGGVASGDCLDFGVTTPELTAVEVYSDTRWGDWKSALNNGIAMHGLIAVHEDTIYQFTARADELRARGELWTSIDFGVNWVRATDPFDTIWNDLYPVAYSAMYPQDLGHWAMQIVDGNLVTMYGSWPDKKAGTFVTQDAGVSWNRTYTSVRDSNDVEDPYVGAYGKLTRSPGYMGIDGVQPFYMGEANGTPCVQYGGWLGYGEISDIHILWDSVTFAWSRDCTYVAKIEPSFYIASFSDDRYQVFDSQEGPGRDWNGDPYFSGGQWRRDQSGTYLRNDRNTFLMTLTPDLGKYNSIGGRCDGKNFVMPATNWNVSGNVNEGKYFQIIPPAIGGTGVKPTIVEIDLNPYLVRVEANDGDLHTCSLEYDKAFGGWLLIYSFRDINNNSFPTYVYFRAFHDPTTIVMSDIAKVILPQPLDPEVSTLAETGQGVAIAYSTTQNNFVISTLMVSTPSGYTLRTSTFDNPFFCSLWEFPAGFNPVQDDVLVYQEASACWSPSSVTSQLVEAGYGGIRFESGPLAVADIDATWQTLPADVIDIAAPVNVTQDLPTNSLSFLLGGAWIVTMNVSISHNNAQQARYTGLRLFDVTDNVPLKSTPFPIGRNAEISTFAISTLVDIPLSAEGHQIVVQIGGVDVLTTVELLTYGFSVNHVGAYAGSL